MIRFIDNGGLLRYRKLMVYRRAFPVCWAVPSGLLRMMVGSALILGGLLFPGTRAFALQGVELHKGKQHYSLGLFLEYLIDPSGTLTLSNVTRPGVGFRPSQVPSPNFGFMKGAVWVRFRLSNRSAPVSSWLLEIDYPLIDFVDLYCFDQNNTLRHFSGGRARPFRERQIKHRNNVFRLPIPQGKQILVYVRLQSGSNLPVPLELYSPWAFARKDHESQIGFGLYYGIMLVMVVYNLFLFFSIKDRDYLYFVVFALNWLLVQASINGLAYEYIWPDWVWWNGRYLVFALCIVMVFGMLFAMSFLRMREYLPRLRYVAYILIPLSMLLFVLNFFLPYALTVRVSSVIAILTAIFLMTAGIFSFVRGYRPARYYLIAWVIFLVGAAIFSMRNLGWISHSVVTMYSVQVGSALLVVFLSLALADRISILQAEHLELAAIEKEMGIAKSVQTGILSDPQALDIDDRLEVDICYLPMNKVVSGDYYSISKSEDDRISLIVADATGHGFQAALTTMQIDMMYKETGIISTPDERLEHMNRIWLGRKLNSNFFTCLLLEIFEDRILYASAGHPDCYLLQRKSGEPLRLRSRGMPIGIRANAEFEALEARVGEGDILVLFSDGLYEEFNPAGEEFGQERLRTLLASGAGLSPRALNQLLIEEVSDFTKASHFNDDITLISARIL